MVYRSPNGNFNEFITNFENLLEALPKNNVYITGDFNINLHNITENANAKQYEETFLTNGFSPLISLWTHQMPNPLQTCIDNIFSNNFDNIFITGTIEDRVSHHLPLVLVCDIFCDNAPDPINSAVPKTSYRYNFSQSNISALQDKAIRIVNEHSNINNFEDFMNDFSEAIDESCREESTLTSKRNPIFKPWITPGIINSSNKKHKLHKQWEKSKKNKCRKKTIK